MTNLALLSKQPRCVSSVISWHICPQVPRWLSQLCPPGGSTGTAGKGRGHAGGHGAQKDECFQVTRNGSAASVASVPHPKDSGGTGTPPGLPVSSSSEPFKPSEVPFGVIDLEEGQGECSRSHTTAWLKTCFSQWVCLLSFILSENDIRNLLVLRLLVVGWVKWP